MLLPSKRISSIDSLASPSGQPCDYLCYLQAMVTKKQNYGHRLLDGMIECPTHALFYERGPAVDIAVQKAENDLFKP